MNVSSVKQVDLPFQLIAKSARGSVTPVIAVAIALLVASWSPANFADESGVHKVDSAAQMRNLDNPSNCFLDEKGNSIDASTFQRLIGSEHRVFAIEKRDCIVTARIQDASSREAVQRKADAYAESVVGLRLDNRPIALLDGRKSALIDQEAAVTVINLWFAECSPCLAEIPDLNQVVAHYAGQPIRFLAPTFSERDAIEALTAKHPFDYTIALMDAAEINGILGAGSVTTYPMHLVVDRHGVVRHAILSRIQSAEPIAAVDDVLKNDRLDVRR